MQLDTDDTNILIDGIKLEIDSCEEFIRCWDYKGNENNEDVVDEKKRLKKAIKLLDIFCSSDYYISISAKGDRYDNDKNNRRTEKIQRCYGKH